MDVTDVKNAGCVQGRYEELQRELGYGEFRTSCNNAIKDGLRELVRDATRTCSIPVLFIDRCKDRAVFLKPSLNWYESVLQYVNGKMSDMEDDVTDLCKKPKLTSVLFPEENDTSDTDQADNVETKKGDVEDRAIVVENTVNLFEFYHNGCDERKVPVRNELEKYWTPKVSILHAVGQVFPRLREQKRDNEDKSGKDVLNLAESASRADLLKIIERFVVRRVCNEEVLKQRRQEK